MQVVTRLGGNDFNGIFAPSKLGVRGSPVLPGKTLDIDDFTFIAHAHKRQSERF